MAIWECSYAVLLTELFQFDAVSFIVLIPSPPTVDAARRRAAGIGMRLHQTLSSSTGRGNNVISAVHTFPSFMSLNSGERSWGTLLSSWLSCFLQSTKLL